MGTARHMVREQAKITMELGGELLNLRNFMVFLLGKIEVEKCLLNNFEPTDILTVRGHIMKETVELGTLSGRVVGCNPMLPGMTSQTNQKRLGSNGRSACEPFVTTQRIEFRHGLQLFCH